MARQANGPFVVVGAGIGGIATAVALAREGIAVRVLEQAPEIGEIGAGIQLAPNALRVLDSLGALDAVYAHGFFPPAATMRDARTGAVLTQLEFGSSFVDKYGYPYVVTHRSDLHSALVTAAEATGLVEIQTGAKVISLAQDRSDHVDVKLDSGEVVVAGVVVGADGLHSVLREYVTGGDDLVYAGDFAYRGTVPYDAVAEREGKDDMTWWVGPGMHLIQYPVRGATLYNQVAVFTGKLRGTDPETFGSVEELRERFADTHRYVQQGVAMLDFERRWAMADREPIGAWTRGNVTLLGDAAHPMLQYLAQGGCQALEDALCLAQSFAVQTDVRSALKRYTGARTVRSGQVQHWARRMGEIVHADGVLAEMRNEVLRLRRSDELTQVEWLYGGSRASH